MVMKEGPLLIFILKNLDDNDTGIHFAKVLV